jgi:hypothetical protein
MVPMLVPLLGSSGRYFYFTFKCGSMPVQTVQSQRSGYVRGRALLSRTNSLELGYITQVEGRHDIGRCGCSHDESGDGRVRVRSTD